MKQTIKQPKKHLIHRSWIGYGWIWLLLMGTMILFAACTAITPAGTIPGTTTPGATVPTTTEVPAALNQRQVLAMQLGLDLDEVAIVDVEAVTWSDACLGLGSPVELCLQAETPGYRITLTANGAEYVYHTNEDGSIVRLAAAPEPQLDNVIIDLTVNDESGCNTAQISREQIAFGQCMTTLLSVPILDPARQADIAEFAETFAPFTADISFTGESGAGQVVFNGTGTTEATPTQQRMIGEWARLLRLEAQGGRSGAGWGLALAWHREGGIAGFCDDVTVYVTGAVYVTSCRGQEPTDLAHFRLDAEQLASLYGWIDTYAPFEVEQRDPAVADAMTVRLIFSGGGEQSATEAEQALIADFAQNLFNEGSMSNTEAPAGCPQADAGEQLLVQEAEGYCLLYPAAYSLWQQNPGTTEIISDTIMNHVDPRVSITVEDAAGRTPADVVDGLLSDYAPPGFDIEPQSITVDGVEATLLDEVPGQDLTRRVVLVHNDLIYSFFFAPIGEAGTATRDTAEALYTTVIDSFHLLDGEMSAAPVTPPGGESVLLWEGQPLFAEDENACGRLTIATSGAATVGACGETGGETYPLSGTHGLEWQELQMHFAAPFTLTLDGQTLAYGTGGAAADGARQRALAAWAQLVHAELATGQVSATGPTVMSWTVGEVPDQPDFCRHLTVLSYGYAYATTVPCAGGPTESQTGGWLTDDELTQFDSWLYGYDEFYVDDNYLAGRGEQTSSASEITAITSWAENVYTRLANQASAD